MAIQREALAFPPFIPFLPPLLLGRADQVSSSLSLSTSLLLGIFTSLLSFLLAVPTSVLFASPLRRFRCKSPRCRRWRRSLCESVAWLWKTCRQWQWSSKTWIKRLNFNDNARYFVSVGFLQFTNYFSSS